MWLSPIFGDKVSAQHTDQVKPLCCRPRGIRSREKQPVSPLFFWLCTSISQFLSSRAGISSAATRWVSSNNKDAVWETTTGGEPNPGRMASPHMEECFLCDHFWVFSGGQVGRKMKEAPLLALPDSAGQRAWSLRRQSDVYNSVQKSWLCHPQLHACAVR